MKKVIKNIGTEIQADHVKYIGDIVVDLREVRIWVKLVI